MTRGRAVASIESADPAVGLASSYLRATAGRASALGAGIAAAAAAFTVLGMTGAAPATQIHGRVPAAAGLDPCRMALSVLVLLLGAVFFANGARAALRARCRDLATLRALGWRRRQVSRQLLQEFGLIAIGSGLLAMLVAATAEAALGGRWAAGWPLVSMPPAATMMIAAAWWPVRRSMTEAEPGRPALNAFRPAVPPRRRHRRIAGQTVRNLQRASSRTTLSALVIAAACAALGQELAVRWAFGGEVTGSWLGQPVTWHADSLDAAAVVTILAMAVITVADLDWLGDAERAIDLRTLQAIGWPRHGVVRLVVSEAVLLGLAGGLAGSVIEVAGSVAIAHHAPDRLPAVTAAVVGAGVLISLVAAGLSAAVGRGRRIGMPH